MKYVDVIPPLIKLIKNFFDFRIYGNMFPPDAVLPSVMIRTAGGNGYTRLQIIARAHTAQEAMNNLIAFMNQLESLSSIPGVQTIWIEREQNPMPDMDEDTQKPEAWVYMRLEHLEA